MVQLAPVFRAITLVEENLLTPIDVTAMAEAASYSLYYFCRIFGKATRHTPHDYLIRRRMTEAAGAVITTDQKIIDIALSYQFNSHECFTRAFGRMFAMSPSEARELGTVPSLRCLPPLTYRHLLCLQTHNDLTPDIIPARPLGNGEHAAIHFESLVVPQLSDANIPGQNGKKLTATFYARFALAAEPADLPLVLDWVLHTWLFYAPYQLARSHVLLELENGVPRGLYIPVTKAQK